MRTFCALALVLALAAPAAAAEIDWSNATLPPGVARSTLTVAGVPTRVFQAGDPASREAIVFVHGHPGSADDWPQLVSVAARHARAVAIDMPGFGEAGDGPDFDYSVPGEAAWLDAALGALGIDRVHLVLHDFGGPFGLEWAKSHPERLASVVLLNTGVFIDYYGHPLAYMWSVPRLGEASMDMQTRASFGATMQAGSLRPLPASYVDTAWGHYDDATRAAALALYRSFGSPTAADAMGRSQAAVLSRQRRPALVIWGASDPYVPVYVAYEQQKAFPDAQVVELAAGHWPFVELPYTVESLVDGFWAQHL